MNKEPYVFYIGGFLNERIVKERGLPTRNPAGSNRMHRIANAIKTTGQNILIVSPAVSMRMNFRRPMFQASLQRSGKVPVLFTAAVGWPILGMLSSFITAPLALLSVSRTYKPSSVIIYNFSPLLVLIAFVYRYIFKVPVYQNIEDVSFPKRSDWSSKTEVRPVQQIVFYYSMKAITKMSQGSIVPSKRFLDYLDREKPYRLITGCINVPQQESVFSRTVSNKINILFSGKIEFEHGIDMFLESLNRINEDIALASKIKVDICGGGSKTAWLIDKTKYINNVELKFHGFVEDRVYARLLEEADLCIALQNPHGRYATNKTPSKVYEYLGNYKAVIATDVGDLATLPAEVITICQPYKSNRLTEIIKEYTENMQMLDKQSEKAGKYAYEHFSYHKTGNEITDFIRTRR